MSPQTTIVSTKKKGIRSSHLFNVDITKKCIGLLLCNS